MDANAPGGFFADLKPGDHLCCIYETEEEHRAVLAPYLLQGLERHEKVLYVVDAHTADTVLGYLRSSAVDVESHLASGQLALLTREDAYLCDGHFDPSRMIALLQSETDRALTEGWGALRVTGEMTWALRGEPGSERLIEYEARLNDFFPGSKCLAICQYDRRRFSADILLDVLHTHPTALIGTKKYDNFYFVPPAAFLGNRPEGRLQQWTKALADHAEDERRRTFALDVLRSLNSRQGSRDAVPQLLGLIQAFTGVEAVAIRLREGEDFPYFVTQGFSRVFVEANNLLRVCDAAGVAVRDPDGSLRLDCMCGSVLCGRTDPKRDVFTADGGFWTNSSTEFLGSLDEVDRQGRICDRCHDEGYESVALLPLRGGGEVVGLLQLCDRRPRCFDGPLIHFLEGVSASIGIAVAQWRAAERVHLLNRLYRTISEINQLIVRESDRECLLAEVCRIAVEHGEFRMAWAGLIDRDGEVLKPVASAGAGSEYVGELEVRLSGGGAALHPAARAILEDRPVIVSDTETDAAFAPWRPAAAGRGLRSSAALPIGVRGTVRGVLEVCAGTAAVFDTEVLRLFEEVAADLGHALGALEIEEERNRSEERYRQLAENAADVIYRYRFLPPAGFEYVSPAITRLVGYTPEEHYADPELPVKLVHPEDQPAARDVRDGRIPQEPIELRWLAKDGTVVWTEQRLTAVRDESGRMVAVEGVARDISGRRRAEETLRETQRQLLQAQKIEAIGRLAGGVAHDFNNLLGVIIGHGEALGNLLGPHHPGWPKIERILQTSERAAGLTRQLLAFSRKQVMQPRVVQLNTILADLEDMLRRLIGEDVQLLMRLAPDLGTVKVDPGQIEQVVMNLAVNARDAMPEGGRLTIETANTDLDLAYAVGHQPLHPGPYVMLAVADTGIGMDAPTQARLFEPFFTTKPVGQGTGLGLATVYGIVKQSEGFIWVYSEPDRGTTFRVYLPRLAELAEQTKAGPAPRAELARGSETVLVVEDEASLCDIAREALERLGYRVLTASDVPEALWVARGYEGRIDLLLTDVVMPHGSGRQLAEALLQGRPGLSVLYMSGYTTETIAKHGVLEEGLHLLEKPFTLRSLASKVREVLGYERA